MAFGSPGTCGIASFTKVDKSMEGDEEMTAEDDWTKRGFCVWHAFDCIHCCIRYMYLLAPQQVGPTPNSDEYKRHNTPKHYMLKHPSSRTSDVRQDQTAVIIQTIPSQRSSVEVQPSETQVILFSPPFRRAPLLEPRTRLPQSSSRTLPMLMHQKWRR